MPRFIVACKSCGKEAEHDKEKSTSNWTVYKNGPCLSCGGNTVTMPVTEMKRLQKVVAGGRS